MWVTSLVVDKNGVLWSGSYDGTIRGWKGPWENGTCIAVLYGHKSSVASLAISVDDNLWSGSQDGTIIMWEDNAEGREGERKGEEKDNWFRE